VVIDLGEILFLYQQCKEALDKKGRGMKRGTLQKPFCPSKNNYGLFLDYKI